MRAFPRTHRRAMRTPERLALHSPIVHCALRLATTLFSSAAFVAFSAVAFRGPTELAGGSIVLLLVLTSWWVYSGRYWCVYLTPTALVARRWLEVRSVPRQNLQGLTKPAYARAWLGFVWRERRIAIRGGAPICFVCSRRAERLLASRET
jgi:hypothetical protein